MVVLHWIALCGVVALPWGFDIPAKDVGVVTPGPKATLGSALDGATEEDEVGLFFQSVHSRYFGIQ